MSVEQLKLKQDDYKRLYEECSDRLRYIEDFIGDATVNEIKELRESVRDKTNQLIEKDKQIAVLSESVKEKDNTIRLLRENRDKELIEARKQERAYIGRVKDIESDEKVRHAKANTAYKVRQDEVKPLKAKYEALLEHIGETTDRTDKNLIYLIDIVTAGFDKLTQLKLEGKTQEEIVEQIDKIKKDSIEEIKNETLKPSKDDITEECKRIHSLLEQGKTQKEVANIMYPGLKRREIKVSTRVNSETYRKLFNIQ